MKSIKSIAISLWLLASIAAADRPYPRFAQKAQDFVRRDETELKVDVSLVAEEVVGAETSNLPPYAPEQTPHTRRPNHLARRRPVPVSEGDKQADADLASFQKRKNIKASEAKGAGYLKALSDAIASGKPDVGDKRSLKEHGYRSRIVSDEPPAGKSYLEEFKIDTEIQARWKEAVVWRKGPKYSSKLPILDTKVSVKQGVIIVQQSFRSRDANTGPRATWSDMLMDTWRRASKKDVRKLKFIARDMIIESPAKDSKGIQLHTKAAIDEVYKRKKREDGHLVLSVETKKNSELKCVRLLAAQTHVARVLQMLADHHNELGNLVLKRINLFKTKGSETYNFHDMVMELGA